MHEIYRAGKIGVLLEYFFDDFPNVPKRYERKKRTYGGENPRGVGKVPVTAGLAHKP